VETWLRGFYDAKFVITDSFHGMAFSIIFNKPFLCCINEKRGKARFKSLAKQFGLEEQLVFSEKDFSIEKINNSIIWQFVNEQIAIKQQNSLLFLEQISIS
jgi:exopolysaccharide biosynthesis predicted pyruvyltransferase EpsI